MFSQTAIQSYFPPESSNFSQLWHSTVTAGKVPASIDPSPPVPDTGPSEAQHIWHLHTKYRTVNVAELQPGPGCVTVTGRIANLYELPNTSESLAAAKGSYTFVVKDDTGALTVKLWYAETAYSPKIGLLVTLWTPHISHAQSNSVTTQRAPLITNIFPERDNTCYFKIHEDDQGVLCKTPLGYREGKPLTKLMTLFNFIKGGHEVPDARILVCVKSVGGKKKFSTKKGTPTEKVDVHVFDDTADATLSLWRCTVASSAGWKPSETVLLITGADFKDDQKRHVTLKNETYVDVDPIMTEAHWLRGFAQSKTKRESVNQAFPDGVFDIETAEQSEMRILFTLADIDEFARAAPSQRYMGYLNLTVIELNVSSLYQRNTLLCSECCGVPIYANAISTTCKQCDQYVPLRINPRLVGLLVDETGGIQAGKLIWSDEAWWQLLGRMPEELVTMGSEHLQYLEQRLLFLKIAILFGWCIEVGRLVVLKVTTV